MMQSVSCSYSKSSKQMEHPLWFLSWASCYQESVNLPIRTTEEGSGHAQYPHNKPLGYSSISTRQVCQPSTVVDPKLCPFCLLSPSSPKQGSLLKIGQPNVSADPSKNWDVQLRRQLISNVPETSQSIMGPEARAQRVSKLSASQRPFAVGAGATAWLEEASIPIEGSGASLSSLSEIPEGYRPPQAGISKDVTLDLAAEQQTKQFLAGISREGNAAQRPFAAGEAAKGWLEEASSPLERPAASSDLASFYEGPSQTGNSGDKAFDERAEKQANDYLAGLSDTLNALPRPFAAGYNVPHWLEAASTPMVRQLLANTICSCTSFSSPFSIVARSLNTQSCSNLPYDALASIKPALASIKPI